MCRLFRIVSEVVIFFTLMIKVAPILINLKKRNATSGISRCHFLVICFGKLCSCWTWSPDDCQRCGKLEINIEITFKRVNKSFRINGKQSLQIRKQVFSNQTTRIIVLIEWFSVWFPIETLLVVDHCAL